MRVAPARVLGLCAWLTAAAVSRASPQRVVVSGAGPAGLLAAHALLSRREDVRVQLFDKREDPRTTKASAVRAYSLGLNIRGRTALQRWPGVWEAVAARGVLSSKFLLYVGKERSIQLRSNRDGSVPTLLIARDELCAALLDELERQHGGSRLELRLGEPLEAVDLSRRECVTASGASVPYDGLIGADGVNSCVRAALEAQSRGFVSETAELPGQFKVFVQPWPAGLDPEAVHAMGGAKAGYGLFSIPRSQSEVCTLLSWSGGAEPGFLAAEDGAAIAARIGEDFPAYGAPSASACEQLRAQRPSLARTVRCNRYHDERGAALLLGDAAHSTGGTLGQGANSALGDVVALDRLLEAVDTPAESSVVAAVGPDFSRVQVAEGLALWQLLQLPPRGPLAAPYLATQLARGALTRLTSRLPDGLRVDPPVQTLLSETTTPFSEIVRRNEAWVRAGLADAPGRPISDFQ